jgi:hypothetical protein
MREYIHFTLNLFKYYRSRLEKVNNSDELIIRHFRTWSQVNHQNQEGLRVALKLLKNQAAIIVETGTSAYGTDSSRLFDAFVSNFGGSFYSVDISAYPSRRLKLQHSPRSFFEVSDSLSYLRSLPKILKQDKIDLVYLDSWDVDWANPTQSALHGFEEYLLVRPYLKKGSILVIDDTPSSLSWIPSDFHEVALDYERINGVLPGKGALIVKELQTNSNVQKIWHDYNCVYLFS